MTRTAADALAAATNPTGKVHPLLADLPPAPVAPQAPCTVHTWCVETGDHFEHYSPYVTAPNPDAYGRDVLPAGLTDFHGVTTVGLLDLDLTPAEARDRLAELRAHLNHVEQLITLAERDRADQ
ncbi:hypothetical protein [Streptomyces yangpuensis]|uniref:hypothetical protein n=1 Tax=Streptomyces yangpuensis TaxID=1648182 RepID=UPI00380A0813